MSIKVLVIGAGRIGAEALAHVVSSGFDDIQIVSFKKNLNWHHITYSI